MRHKKYSCNAKHQGIETARLSGTETNKKHRNIRSPIDLGNNAVFQIK